MISPEDIKTVTLVVSLLIQFGGTVVAFGKLATTVGKLVETLNNHGILLADLTASVRDVKENHYLLKHREAREFLHKHTQECRTVAH